LKQVIFVGGTSYSGSTFLAMTLANDPRGFACGEPRNFLNPTRPHHSTLVCTCGDPKCRVWLATRERGAKHVYETIFELCPDVEFVVDSSKDPFWIQWQAKRLSKLGIGTRNLLIWKTPQEIARSFLKRGRAHQWEKAWLTYHRLYLTLVEDWRAVKYADYAQDQSVLEKVCHYLDLTFFERKSSYWERDHHVIGGNHSAKVHLYPEGSAGYLESFKKHPASDLADVEGSHRSVYYRENQSVSRRERVDGEIQDPARVGAVLDLLNARSIGSDVSSEKDWSALRMSPLNLRLRRAKRWFMVARGRARFGQGF
jgi:hypothetical protein